MCSEEKRATRCSNCGLPKSIGRGNVWHPNGVVTASYPPHIRGTMYDVEELNSLFPAISERIGFDISRLVVEGKRKDGKRYTSSLINNLKAMGREVSPREVYEMISRFCRYWGLGKAEIIDHREGEWLSIRSRDHYNELMSCGDWAGVFEAAENRRGEAGWRDERKEIIDIRAVEGDPELEERIEQEVELGIPFVEEGDLHYVNCPECGVPLEVSRQFSWDADEAMIVEKISGRRFVLHNTNGIVAVIRVLREELGEEVFRMITEISRDYARRYYGEIREETSMDMELMKLPLRSWGRPARLVREGEGFRLRIVNPYCPSVVAGRVWGMLEAFHERELTLAGLEEGEGYLDVSFQG